MFLYCAEVNVQNIVILAVGVTEENFEDLLANDDVFLDYFNAFLCLPVSFLPDLYLSCRISVV